MEQINDLKEIILNYIDKNKGAYIELSRDIWNNPEIGYQEHIASEKLVKTLKENGFSVKKGIGNMDTAFIGIKDSGKEGPCIGIVSEYDALPEIGHACGHNLFGVSSILAGVALGEVIHKTGGKIKVIGSPAEEGTVPNAGGKIYLLKDGVFDDVDISMMCHAEGRTIVERQLVATTSLRIEFKGKAAHAGGSPEQGINALSAGIATINNINMLRQHFIKNTVVNVIITEGGVGQNTIPDKCVLEMSIRAETREILEDVVNKIKNCIKAGSIATGCSYEEEVSKSTYENLISNHTLANSFKSNLDLMEVPYIDSESTNYGWDIGNVSHVCPTIAPYIKIGDENLVGHTEEFKAASCSIEGFEGMLIGAKAMALTSLDYLTDEELRNQVKLEFDNRYN